MSAESSTCSYPAEEINELHAEAVRLAGQSRDALRGALVAAWNAGQLLIAAKGHVRRLMGPGGWQLWLEGHFSGTPRTAQRYMLLAKGLPNPSNLEGISLRQTYFRLGIATEPKTPGRTLAPIARHAVLATRLLCLLDTPSPELRRAYQRDLQPLYERLHSLFESNS